MTGSAGYIGAHLLQIAPKVRTCDLKDGQDFVDIKGDEFDIVIHLAAHASVTQSLKDPDECLDNNAFKLIPFLRNNKIGKFVFASTGGAIYGNRHFAMETDASWEGCISPYGQSKYLAERIIQEIHPNYTILRFGNVYGGWDADRLEAACHRHFMVDNPIVVYGGDQIRDFVHVDVICRALITAARSSIAGVFNIGSGKETKVMDLAKEFSLRRDVPIVCEPARPGEIDCISLDIRKARQRGLILT